MVKKLASKIGETSEGWLLRHGMTWEDAKAEAYPAVHDAAKSYDPKRGAFGTHAYYFILKRLRRSVSPQDALNRTSYYEPPDRAEPAQEPNDEPDLIVWLFRPPPGEHVKRRLRDLDAEDLNRADRLLPLPGPRRNASRRYVHGILTDPDRLRRVLDAMIEEKRRAMRGNSDEELGMWLDRIADVDRQRARAQDLAVEGLLSPEELRAKLSTLEKKREAARSELEALRGRKEEVEELERDRDTLLESYVGMVPEGLDYFSAEDRRWAYGRIRLNVFAESDGSLVATWALTKDIGVISEDAHQDEGNAWGRLGEVLRRLGCEDGARKA